MKKSKTEELIKIIENIHGIKMDYSAKEHVTKKMRECFDAAKEITWKANEQGYPKYDTFKDFNDE